MKKLKITTIGYTTFIAEDQKQKRSFVVVRKNLLGGYTIIDSDGKKKKITDFSLDGLRIHSSSWQLLSNCTLVKSVNESLTSQYNQSVQLQSQLESVSQERDSVNSQLAGAQSRLETAGTRIERLGEDLQQVQKLTSEQRQSLKFGLDLACFVHCHHEWEETHYGTPNQLQRSAYGMTVVPRTEYREEDYQTKLDWEQYFEFLLKSDKVLDKCKETIAQLKLMFKELECKVNSLSDKSLASDYTKASSMKTSFIMQLRDFFYLYRNEMGATDIYYHSSFTNHLPGDEEDKYTYSAHDIVAEGEKNCARLIQSLFGLEEANKFSQQIQELSVPKNAGQATM